MTEEATPNTVVLVHGFWVTPRGWEKWVERYEGKGYRVIAPAYPGFEIEVEALSHQETYVDFRNEDRAPLLFIAGSEDNIMPPAVNQSNVKHYRHTKSPTDYREFEGRSHYSVIGGESCEEVANFDLEWAVEHARANTTT